jgi:hypothetical protein
MRRLFGIAEQFSREDGSTCCDVGLVEALSNLSWEVKRVLG